jgi:hypothetical protein
MEPYRNRHQWPSRLAKKSTAASSSPNVSKLKQAMSQSPTTQPESPTTSLLAYPDSWIKIARQKGHGINVQYLVEAQCDKFGHSRRWLNLQQVRKHRLDILEAYKKMRSQESRLKHMERGEQRAQSSSGADHRGRSGNSPPSSSSSFSSHSPPQMPESPSQSAQTLIESPQSVESSPTHSLSPSSTISQPATSGRFSEPTPTTVPEKPRINQPEPYESAQKTPEVKDFCCQAEIEKQEPKKQVAEMSTQTNLSYFVWDTVC